MRNIRRTFNASKNFSRAWKFSGIGIRSCLAPRGSEQALLGEVVHIPAHNLKVVGSNPTPATKDSAAKIIS